LFYKYHLHADNAKNDENVFAEEHDVFFDEGFAPHLDKIDESIFKSIFPMYNFDRVDNTETVETVSCHENMI